jgi:hypothetical protein
VHRRTHQICPIAGQTLRVAHELKRR